MDLELKFWLQPVMIERKNSIESPIGFLLVFIQISHGLYAYFPWSQDYD